MKSTNRFLVFGIVSVKLFRISDSRVEECLMQAIGLFSMSAGTDVLSFS